MKGDIKSAASAAASSGAEVLNEQVKNVANIYIKEGFVGVATEVAKNQVVDRITALAGPAILAAGVGMGVHATLTAASPLSSKAKQHGDDLVEALEKEDSAAAKLAVGALFKAAPTTARKDLAPFLRVNGGFAAQVLAQKLDEDRAERGIFERTRDRVGGVVEGAKGWVKSLFGRAEDNEEVPERAKSRIESVYKMIDLAMADLHDIENQLKPVSSSSAAAATKSSDLD